MQIGIYRHYKGNLYEVLGVAHHSETLEEMVVYRTLYDAPGFGLHSLWVRPKKMFEEAVEWEGKRVSRFSFIEE